MKKNNTDIDFEKIIFKQRPIPIPIDYRPTYKISIIILVLKLCSTSETASLLKLHLFSWILKSEDNRLLFNKFIQSNYLMEFNVWSIEPALNRALQYSIADELCELTNTSKYKLTEKGKLLYSAISDSNTFDEEIYFLKKIGKNKITDKRLDVMTKQWEFNYE